MQNSDLEKVLDRLKRKGFHNLELQELQKVLENPQWTKRFRQELAADWPDFQYRAKERLGRHSKTPQVKTGSLGPLLSAASRGDTYFLTEFLKKHSLKECQAAKDDSMKSCLHLAARNGHSEAVKFLCGKGWEVEAKDKLDTTPLHQACERGHLLVLNALLQAGANPRTKDSLGRNSFLYSACSHNPELIREIAKYDQQIVLEKDHNGRNALHYAVHNPHSNQVEVLKSILDSGVPVDLPDNESKTPLHYSAEAGKLKAIKVLLKFGANVYAREVSTHKTPIDLSVNSNVKEFIMVNAGLTKKSEKTLKPFQEEPKPLPKKLTQHKSPKEPLEPKEFKESRETPKDKLIQLLKKIQEAGVENRHHISNPQLYSGTWIEGVVSAGALYNELSSHSPSEAVLKVFNVLYPYPYPLPKPQNEDYDMQQFFNKQPAYQESTPASAPVSASDSAKDKEILDLKVQLEELRQKHRDSLNMLPSQAKIEQVQRENKEASLEITKLTQKLNELQEALDSKNSEIQLLKEELSTKPDPKELESLKAQLQNFSQENQALRFKAGQVFLKSLDEVHKEPTSTVSTVSLQDDEILQRLQNSLKGNPPSFKQRLIDSDSNKDLKVSKGELAKVLAELKLPPQDVIVVLRVAGFRQNVPSVAIEEVTQILKNRETAKEKNETQLFNKLREELKKGNLETEQAFAYIDTDSDGYVSFREFKESLNMLNLSISRKEVHSLFAVLDQDHNGQISIQELKQKLESVPQKPSQEFAQQLAKTKFLNKLPTSEPPKEPEFVTNKSVPKPPLPKPKQTQQPKKKLNGSLVVGIVRAKGLEAQNYQVKAMLEGSEKTLQTDSVAGPNPAWKFKGRIRLYDTDTSQVAQEVYLELHSDKGLEAFSRVSWHSALDFPNTWAYKAEHDMVQTNSRKLCSVVVHFMWIPKETLQVEGTGELLVELLNCRGFPESVIRFGVNNETAKSQLKASEVLKLRAVQIKPPVPFLKCSVMRSDTLQMVLWRNLSIEMALNNQGEWTPKLDVPLNEEFKLSLRLKWTPQTQEEQTQQKAATLIQKVWRGAQSRLQSYIQKTPKRKLVTRRAVKQEQRYYLVSVFEEGETYLLEFHLADDPQTPMYLPFKTKSVPKQPLEELFGNLSM